MAQKAIRLVTAPAAEFLLAAMVVLGGTGEAAFAGPEWLALPSLATAAAMFLHSIYRWDRELTTRGTAGGQVG